MLFKFKKQIIISAVIAFAVIVLISVALILRGDAKPVDTDVSSDNNSSVVSEISSEQISSDEQSSEPGSLEPEPEPIRFAVSAPKKDVTVYVDHILFKGTADPEKPLFINDEEVEVNENGLFSKQVTLTVGNNWFSVKQDGQEYKCVVRYRKTIILEVSPTGSQTVDGGSMLTVKATALAGSTVKAALNGKTITLEEKAIEQQEEYSEFYGRFEMPVNYEKNVSLGSVTFSATSKSGTGKKTGAKITVKKSERPPEEQYYMPTGKNYIDVGHTYIAEVVCRSAEVMNVDDNVDYSRPTNNYLPKGTVDYCSATENKLSNSLSFRVLRYGKQLYTKTSGVGANIKVYEGSLPDTNKVEIASFSSEGRHSTLTLNVDWKAPFYFDLNNQSYTRDGKSNLDYTIKSATYTYVDITFCYAEALTGEFDLTDNLIFERYEIIKNESDYTLRLHLRRKGMFYGWSAEYNAEGQLVFSFLNPATLKTAENKYGYSLEGVTILVDAGHGGSQSGTDGFYPGNYEKVYTLMLAKKLEERLKSYGATVIMTRTDDSTVEAEARMNMVRDTKPDYAISIHRNASTSINPRGFISYHFNAFTASAAEYIFNETANKADLYEDSKWEGVKWHYFFLSRCTECPSVLTENGFMSNPEEYSQIIDPAFNDRCADAFVDGIFAYFKSIQ